VSGQVVEPEDGVVLASREKKENGKKTGLRFTARGGRRTNPEFKALRHFAEYERDALLRGGPGGRPMDHASFRLQEDHMRLIRALVKPLLAARCDYPSGETAVNERGGHTYALLIQLPRDVWPVDTTEQTFVKIAASLDEESEDAPFFVACEGDSWEALFAVVETKSREGEWWTRAIGQRQAVYDRVYERRFRLTGDDEDALDFAIGAADMPLLDLDYFAQWCAAAPHEVRQHPVALRVLKTMAGNKAEAYLAEWEALLQGESGRKIVGTATGEDEA
jgi:hypothetical protein